MQALNKNYFANRVESYFLTSGAFIPSQSGPTTTPTIAKRTIESTPTSAAEVLKVARAPKVIGNMKAQENEF